MGLIDKAAILAASDLKSEDVTVPEWGGTVRVRSMSGIERDAWETSLAPAAGGRPDLANLRARLVVRCIVGEDGARLFADDDADALGAKSAAAIGRVFDVAQRLNGLQPQAIEDAEKN